MSSPPPKHLSFDQRALLTAALANSLTSEQLAALCASQPALAAIWHEAQRHEEHMRRVAALVRLANAGGHAQTLIAAALRERPDDALLRQCAAI